MIELDLEKLTAPSSGHVVDKQDIQHGLYMVSIPGGGGLLHISFNSMNGRV